MARRLSGRRRKDGPRHPNGRRVFIPQDPGYHVALEQRAAAILGEDVKLAALDRRISDASLARDTRLIEALEAEKREAVARVKSVAADERASTPLGLMAVLRIIDDKQHRAGEAYERMHKLVWGIMPGRPVPETVSCLASQIVDAVPLLWHISDADKATQISNTADALREAYARLCTTGDPRLFEDVVVFHRAPNWLTRASERSMAAWRGIEAMKRSLDEIAKYFDRDGERKVRIRAYRAPA